MSGKTRVLVVDDSAFARKVVREVLGGAPDLDVVGIARDGLEALELIASLRPDVVTLDLVMPNLDGIGVLRAVAPKSTAPRFVVVSMAPIEGDLAIEALSLGAVDLVRKPTPLATGRLYDMRSDLLRKVRAAAIARAHATQPAEAAPRWSPPRSAGARLIVIGASTGGPHALTRLVTALPADMPVPIAVALHIPPGYTPALAARLDAASAVSVFEASDRRELRPGEVAFAPGGMHLKIERAGDTAILRLDLAPFDAPHHPSVDVLFHTAVASFGGEVLGIVLTGMGDDGLAGARAIHGVGGAVITESESSCVIYGMPRVVHEAGLDVCQAPIEAIVRELLSQLGTSVGRAPSRPTGT